MDEKLAKGLAREGFRNVDERQQLQGAEIALQLLRGHGRLIGKQKLSKAATQKSFEELSELFGRLPDTVFVEQHVDVRKKKLSSDFKAFLIAGLLSFGKVDLEHQEQAIGYSILCFQFGRKKLTARELDLSLVVRQHAVNRYIERGDRQFSSIGRALWPGLLFVEALVRWHKPMALQPFMIPTVDGAFLGLTIPGEPRPATIEEVTYSGEGRVESSEPFSELRSLRQWFLNTFISLDDMRDDQIALRKDIITLISRHEDILMLLHIMGVGMHGGMTVAIQQETIKSGEDIDLAYEKAERDFEPLFNGNLWSAFLKLRRPAC